MKNSGVKIKQITPPEAVPISFVIAPLGSRFAAQTLDYFITIMGFVFILYVIVSTRIIDFNAVWTLAYLLSFLIRTPYYIFSELVWNGQTLGKRAMQISVISADGRTLTPYQIVARNLMKEAEILLPASILLSFSYFSPAWAIVGWCWVGLCLLYPVVNKENKRFGDAIAETIVVARPKVQILNDLTEVRNHMFQFDFEPAQLDHYGRVELQTLEEILRREPVNKHDFERDAKVFRAIKKKIQYRGDVPKSKERSFMLDFYEQQRAYLEGKGLFGDRREDKFHDQEKTP